MPKGHELLTGYDPSRHWKQRRRETVIATIMAGVVVCTTGCSSSKTGASPDADSSASEIDAQLAVVRPDAQDVARDHAVDVPSADVGAMVDLGRDVQDAPGAMAAACPGPCLGTPHKPFCVNGQCRPCFEAPAGSCAARSGLLPACDLTSGECVGCVEDKDCPSEELPMCRNGSCAPCTVRPAVCRERFPARSVCSPTGGITGKCVACDKDTDCPTDKPICLDHACVPCTAAGKPGDTACKARSADTPVCETSSGKCVACTQDAHCLVGTKPICRANVCVPCTQQIGYDACLYKSMMVPSANVWCHPNGGCGTCKDDSMCPNEEAPFCIPNESGGAECKACFYAVSDFDARCRAKYPSGRFLCDFKFRSNQCVACLRSSDCTFAGMPICRFSGKVFQCEACSENFECGDRDSKAPYCVKGACSASSVGL